MKLILTGGGINEKAKVAYSLFSQLTKDGEILYLPFAEERISVEENAKWIENQFKPYGVNKITTISSAQNLTVEKINGAAGIIIGGGNAFILLDKLRKSNKLFLLEKAIENKVILGLSAGATIFSRDINCCLYDELKILANDKNSIGLKNTKGIEIFDGYDFFVHYKLSDNQLSQTQQKVEKILSHGSNVIAIPEESCVFVTEKEVVALGEKPIELITKEGAQEFYHNQKIGLKPRQFNSTLFQFEKANKTQLDEISALYKEVIKTTFTTWDDSYPSQKLLLDDITKGNLYVLKSEGKIIATSFLGKKEYDEETWKIPLSNPMSIARICVFPSLQGKGVGTHFMRLLIDHAKKQGADGMHFHVCTINPSAMRMYEKVGFINCGQGQSNYGFDYFKYEQKFDN